MWPMGICSTWPRVRPWVKGEFAVSVRRWSLLADVVLAGVAHQRAGQQARLAEDLEAVADAHDQAAACGESC